MLKKDPINSETMAEWIYYVKQEMGSLRFQVFLSTRSEVSLISSGDHNLPLLKDRKYVQTVLCTSKYNTLKREREKTLSIILICKVICLVLVLHIM